MAKKFFDLFEALLTQAAKDVSVDNQHAFDRLIMERWDGIRAAAIEAGVFDSINTNQALFEKLKKSISNPGKVQRVIGKFAEFLQKERISQDIYQDEYPRDLHPDKDQWYQQINIFEFWMACSAYIAEWNRKYPDDLLSFENIINDALDPEVRKEPYPSHGGFVANVFSEMNTQRLLKRPPEGQEAKEDSVLTVSYRLEEEGESLYSRLIVGGNVEAFPGLVKRLQESGLECVSNDGQIEILVNVKMLEARNTGMHPGYGIYDSLALLKEAVGENLQFDEDFMSELDRGMKAKVEQANQILKLLGRPAIKQDCSRESFSDVIKYFNTKEDILPFMDKFGEFENCDKIEDLIFGVLRKKREFDIEDRVVDHGEGSSRGKARIRPGVGAGRVAGGLLVAGAVALTIAAIVFPPFAMVLGGAAVAAFLAGATTLAVTEIKRRRAGFPREDQRQGEPQRNDSLPNATSSRLMNRLNIPPEAVASAPRATGQTKRAIKNPEAREAASSRASSPESPSPRGSGRMGL